MLPIPCKFRLGGRRKDILTHPSCLSLSLENLTSTAIESSHFHPSPHPLLPSPSPHLPLHRSPHSPPPHQHLSKPNPRSRPLRLFPWLRFLGTLDLNPWSLGRIRWNLILFSTCLSLIFGQQSDSVVTYPFGLVDDFIGTFKKGTLSILGYSFRRYWDDLPPYFDFLLGGQESKDSSEGKGYSSIGFSTSCFCSCSFFERV